MRREASMCLLASVSVLSCGARSVLGDDDFASQDPASAPTPTIMGIAATPTSSEQAATPEPISTTSNPAPTFAPASAASPGTASVEPSQFNPCDCPEADLGVTVWIEQTQSTGVDAGPHATDAGASMNNDDGGSVDPSTFLGYLDQPVDDSDCQDGQLHLMPDVRCGLRLWLHICQGPYATLPCIRFEGNDVEFTDALGRTFSGSLREGRIGLDKGSPGGLLQGSFALPITGGDTKLELHGTFSFCGLPRRSGIPC